MASPEPSRSNRHRPVIRLKARTHKRFAQGHPWIYANEVQMDNSAKALPAGCVVRLESADGQLLGCGFFNPRPLISARLLSRDPEAAIDRDFFAAVLRRALALREALFDQPYYRLVHAEADGLPGCIIDRYGDVLALQINTAGMARHCEALVEALNAVITPSGITLRSEGQAAALEGLEERFETRGRLEYPLELIENGARYLADPAEGQKTGWFFDQRENRAWIARLAAGRRVLDGYCYSGGFSILAALAGAESLLGLDRSEAALALARRAAVLNGVEPRCSFQRGEVFTTLADLADRGETFGLVILDPPAFVKSRKELKQGLRGYRKLARLGAALVAPGGFLFMASCSHHADLPLFAEQLRLGLRDAGRSGRVLRSSGAGPDHPVHPWLPESAYLKAQALAID